MELFAVTTGRGPAWDASRSIRERKLWGDHAAFADHSVSSGRILLGGPVESDDPRVVALLAVAADDRAGAQEVFADDPWVVAGILEVIDVRAWTVWPHGRGSR